MTKYIPFDIQLTDGQRKAMQKPGQVVLRFTKEQLFADPEGSRLLLTQGQVNKIRRSKDKQKGLEIKLSKRQLHKNQSGGFILPLLAAAASKLAPLAMSGLTGLVSGLANSAASKLVGSSVQLEVPKRHLDELQKAVALLESRHILPDGSRTAIRKDIEQKGGAFMLPLVASLLGSFLPTLFGSKKGTGIYLPWEKI